MDVDNSIILSIYLSAGMKDYYAKICVETFRIKLFLDAGVGDLSGKRRK